MRKKRIKVFMLFLSTLLFLNGCMANSSLKSNSDMASVDVSSVASADSYEVPSDALKIEHTPKKIADEVMGEIDLSTDVLSNYAYSGYEGDIRKWTIRTVGKETKDYYDEIIGKDVLVLEALGSGGAPLPAGINPISINIGEDKWSNYSLSFDFLLNYSDSIFFSIYAESSLIEWDYTKEQVRFTFAINRDGLAIEPIVGNFGYQIKNEKGEKILGKVNMAVWNHVELKLDNKDLHIILNGEDKGVIWTYTDIPHGTVGFGGGESIMIKNICINS